MVLSSYLTTRPFDDAPADVKDIGNSNQRASMDGIIMQMKEVDAWIDG